MGSKRQFDGCVQTKKPVVSQGTELVQQFKLCLPNLRIDTIQRFIDTALAMLSAQSVNHRDLAPHMPGKSSLEGKQRRAERAIHDPQLTPEVFVLLMLIQLPAGKLLISIDRSNWEHGETPLNLLVIGAVVEGYTVPLMWVALDHSGSSDTRARMWLVGRLLQFLPAHRWKGLVADRELSVKIGSVFCVVTVFAVLYAFVGIHGWMGYELTSGLTTLE